MGNLSGNGVVTAAMAMLLFVAFVTFVTWGESPATWEQRNRFLVACFAAIATWCGYAVGANEG